MKTATLEALTRQKAGSLHSKRASRQEARPGVEYGGVYESNKSYPKGVLIRVVAGCGCRCGTTTAGRRGRVRALEIGGQVGEAER